MFDSDRLVVGLLATRTLPFSPAAMASAALSSELFISLTTFPWLDWSVAFCGPSEVFLLASRKSPAEVF
jgi:hypothetical protein